MIQTTTRSEPRTKCETKSPWQTVLFTAALLLALFSLCNPLNAVLAQSPQPQPQPGSQLPNLRPLLLLSIAMDGVARPLGTPGNLSRPAPQITLSRNVTKVLEVNTADGRGNVHFSYSLPSGVPAATFQWAQESVSAPNATGRLQFNGCDSCPASFAITLSAGNVGITESARVEFHLANSTAQPALVSINRNGGNAINPRFDITFQPGSFDQRDSTVFALYQGGLKYRLVPDASSQLAAGSMRVVIPRIKLDRGVSVSMNNPFGNGNSLTVQLPQQDFETAQFVNINSSTVLGEIVDPGDEYSFRHIGNAATGATSGTDELQVRPTQNTTPTACDQSDFIYTGAAVAVINASTNQPVNGQGSATISSQPSVNALLRSPGNKIRIQWSRPALSGDLWYQVVPKGAFVVGVCSDRIIR